MIEDMSSEQLAFAKDCYEPGWSKIIMERIIADQYFYVDNFFEVIGTVTEGCHGNIPVFEKSNEVNRGYLLRTIPGFSLSLSVETPSGKELITIGIPFKHEKKDVKSSTGYNVVDQSTAFDFLPFTCHKGIKIKAEGSLSQILKDRGSVPKGYYLIADINKIHSIN